MRARPVVRYLVACTAVIAAVALLTGGLVAYNPVVAEILAEKLGRDVEIAPDPQFTGAMGAALSALRRVTEPS